jgi:hypothetical protein
MYQLQVPRTSMGQMRALSVGWLRDRGPKTPSRQEREAMPDRVSSPQAVPSLSAVAASLVAD